MADARRIFGESDLRVGTLDAHFSIAQELADAAPAMLRALLAAAIRASQLAVGAEGGQATVTRLENLFRRAEANRDTASIGENTELLGRRPFNPLEAKFARRRKRTVTAFGGPMGQQRRVPAGVPLAHHRHRMLAPHPVPRELFDRLRGD